LTLLKKKLKKQQVCTGAADTTKNIEIEPTIR
jgi:hypothetical protein